MSATDVPTNNLRNIKPRDPPYQLTLSRINSLLPDNAQTLLNAIPQLPIIAGDTYYLHYSVAPTLIHKNPDDILEKVRQFYADYMAGEEFPRTRILTELDEEMSTIYTTKLTKTILEMLREEMEKQLQQAQEEGEEMPQMSLQKLLNQAGQGDAKTQAQLRQLAQKALQAIQQKQRGQGLQKALAEAHRQARRATEKADQLRELMGGREAGKTPAELKEMLDLTEEVLSVPDVAKIVSTAAKLWDSLPRFTKLKKQTGRRGEEVSGYGYTRNPERALPRELALPEEMFYRKLITGFLTREYHTVSEGSYYVLVDSSGSMAGEKTVWARSVALALFALARRKGRRFFFRFFDSETHPLADDSNPLEVVRALAKDYSGGGTDIDRAIAVALEDIKHHSLDRYTNTIVIITDGEDDVDDWTPHLRQHGCELISVMIKGDNPSLRQASSQYLQAQLSSQDALKLLEVAAR